VNVDSTGNAIGAARTAAPTATWQERFALWRWRHRHPLVAYTVLVPMLLYFIVFTWIPIIVLFVISFTEYNVVEWPPTFVGLKNYIQFFTDPYYHKVSQVTVTLGLAVLILNMGLGLGIAMLLNEKIKGRGIYRTIWYLPVVISGAVMAQTMVIFLYPGATGVFNSIIGLFGAKPIIWTQSTFWTPVWITLFAVWRGVGVVVIFFLAGLQSIDPVLYEAARVDGASRPQSFRHITLPQLAPITLFVFVTQCVGALQMWEAPLVLTFGGPDNSTRTMVYSIYSDAFGNLTMGLATAQSVILLIVLLALSAFNLRVFRVKY
jgi:ABC-type sugar transport system permease subunit